MKIAVLGIDLGKNVCSVVGLDPSGAVVLRRRVRRDTLIDLVAKLPSCIVGMEACCGAHHLGRLFAAQGHDIRLMSPEYVRPYVKAQKNDDRDAEEIAEAATRPTMRFVEMKTEDQLDMQTLHRSRERLVGERTALINQLRAILLDRGIVVPQGKRKLEQYLVILMNEHDGEGLSARMRMLVADIRAQWQELDRRIGEFDARVRTLGERERRCSTAGNDSWCRRDDFDGSDCSRWQGRDFRAWSRSCGMAGLGSASVDDRRQATTHGDQQARKQVPAQAADPWSTSGTALCCGKGHRTWPMGEEFAQPCPSECRGRSVCQ